MKRVTSAIICLSAFLFTGGWARSEIIHVASIEGLAEQLIAKQILSDIYRQLGYQLEVTPLPARRATLATQAGGFDGELLRIESYGHLNPELVRIPIAIGIIETHAFAQPSFKLDSANIEDFRYAIVRGVKHTKDATAGFANITTFESSAPMLRFASANRADMALTSKLDGLFQAKTLGLSEQIVPVGEPWSWFPVYHYVHRRHEALIEGLIGELENLAASGDLEKLWKQEAEKLLAADVE